MKLADLILPSLLALACGPARAALDVPGRHHPPHEAAQAEALLAEARTVLERGDADGALAVLARVPLPLSESQAFRRGVLEGRALVAVGRLADAAAPLGDAARAATSSSRALTPALEVVLGRAAHAGGDCARALAAFRRAELPALVRDTQGVEAQALCLVTSGERGRALATLDAALDRHGAAGVPLDVHALRVLRARLLIEAGLERSADDDVHAIARLADADELAALAHGWVSPALAGPLVEAGLARFPDDPRFPALAARLWQSSAPRAAARVALRGRALTSTASTASADAAELLRAVGDLEGARRENAAVDDTKVRLRQRLAIAIDDAAWDRAVALRGRLASAGLLDEDAVAFALAWASHEIGDDDVAAALLDRIDDAAWFERVTALRAAVLACAEGARCSR